ncbi:hypothetical protein ACPYO6_01455 [Georgenia sp. Z1344]|uniref:hypothetical protein n=1 Tax=Georgenia sp. Z1344 TaxID=3416706 RepID=UPI003CF40DC5
MTVRRPAATMFTVGLLATCLAACGGGGEELSESEACDEFSTIYQEMEQRTLELTDLSDVGAVQEIFADYGEQSADLAERSPDNLRPLFEEEAAFGEAAGGGTPDPDLIASNAENEAAIREICGEFSGYGTGGGSVG